MKTPEKNLDFYDGFPLNVQFYPIYSKRMGLIEPVFANIRSTLSLDHFSLRGQINTQWLLYCITDNIGKIQKYGLRAA